MVALKDAGDENAQLAALSELCELLAVSSEEALTIFPVDSLVPLLVRTFCLKKYQFFTYSTSLLILEPFGLMGAIPRHYGINSNP